MKTITRTISDLIAVEHPRSSRRRSRRRSPLPLEVIPNYMGINLCSVDSVSWTEQDDGQLVDLTIRFIPEPKEST